VRGEFEPKTWRAFWSTAVENHSIQNTASALKMSVGAVYVARSRVMSRLRSRVQEITLDGIPDALELLERAASEEITA
jgi:RNA polymerase sigma-70 factor (ECF subfamily)